ncbi:MAG: hypothetical protein HYY93_01085 [Planctomycetes bacterium]|nr:hypothetical protein [Planctomycetota bacterium]
MGQAAGGKVPETPDDIAFDKSKVKGQIGKGEILGGKFVKGLPKKGEVMTEYVDVVQSAKQEATDAFSKDDIPAGYRRYVIDYFDSINPQNAPAAPEPGGTTQPPK